MPTPPGPRLPAFFFTRRTPHNMWALAQQYGDVVNMNVIGQPVYLLNHPDYIRDVLVTHHTQFQKSPVLRRLKAMLGEGLLTSEAPLHLHQRRLIQPIFHRQRIAGYGGAMVALADQQRATWRPGSLNVAREMTQLTMRVVARTLFATEVEADAEFIGQTMERLSALFPFALLPFSKQIERLPVGPGHAFHQSRAQLDKIIYRLIAERRATGDRGDLLSMLLFTQGENGEEQPMSDEQARDEALTLFLAGHETTANALAWAWYALAQNPKAEALLHAELDAVLGGRLPTVDDVEQLKVTRMVLAETMRLYPPAWVIARQSLSEYTVDGYTFPKDTMFMLCQWVMHRDPRYYPQPHKFNLNRWTPEAQAARPKFAYFPFGGGPRLCIGEGFAWMEGILLLATLAQQWRFRLLPGTQVAFQSGVTLRPAGGLMMVAEQR